MNRLGTPPIHTGKAKSPTRFKWAHVKGRLAVARQRALRIAGAELRIDTRRRHPQPAARIEVDLEWLADRRVGGEQIDLVTLGHLHRLEFRRRIGDGDVGEGALRGGDRGTRDRQEEGQEEGQEGGHEEGRQQGAQR